MQRVVSLFAEREVVPTVAVERTLIEQDFSRARRAEMVDNMAAAHILQAAIDALVNA